MRDWLALVRPVQWVKNGFVLAPLVFSRRLLEPEAGFAALVAFAAFCLASSAAYVANDIADRDRDRRHPLKRDRPLAAGRVDTWRAARLAAVLGAGAFALAAWLGWRFSAVVAAFVALQMLYSAVLKEVVVADVAAIATGFVLRAAGGVVAVGARMSGWLLLCTFLLAAVMALGKRRHEALLIGDDAHRHREVLGRYTVALLDRMIAAAAAATLVAYGLYAWSPAVARKLGTERLYLTFPFVVFGLFRYLFLVYRRDAGGSPTDVLLGDAPLQAAIALWLGAVFFLLYR
ncbi:MAG: decaprenyl-phosphate phosphoribosyltransferase [Candidatus Dadabacteria bacterium]|nr:MAG: decaprenyl-phosphate phosphoribosyltransferase [Candidatus Dadabacteria bacterium]